MIGKLAALIIAGFAALVSSQDFRVSEQLKNKMNSFELIPKTSELAVGAFPDGFLSDSQLVKDSDRQWIYDQLPSTVQGRAGNLWYRNGDGFKFTQAITNKRSLIFLLKGEESGAVFGAFT